MDTKKYTDIFIDFDDTLYDTRGNAIIALAEMFELKGLSRYFDDAQIFYDRYWEANIDLWTRYAKGEFERDYLIIERFRRPLSFGSDLETGQGFEPSREFCLDVSDCFLDLCANKPGVIDGAHELMDYLRSRGYRLHMCSNGFHEVQYKKLHACGLLDYFDNIILSEDAGANKPSQQFFDHALKITGAQKESTIMIGDNYNTDIVGAMNAGLDTMLFKRWGKDFVPPQTPTYQVDTLKDIMNIL